MLLTTNRNIVDILLEVEKFTFDKWCYRNIFYDLIDSQLLKDVYRISFVANINMCIKTNINIVGIQQV